MARPRHGGAAWCSNTAVLEQQHDGAHSAGTAAAADGLSGPMMASLGFSFFYFFIPFTEAGIEIASVNAVINRGVRLD